MRRALLFVLFGLLAGATALGQGLANPFDVGLGVRAMGLGGAYTALAEGSEALLANPAGLAWVPSLRADSTVTNVLNLYTVGWLAGALPGWGAGLTYLSVGGIADPAEDPLTFSTFGLVLGFGLDARHIPFLSGLFPFPTAVGLALKYHQITVADASGSGIALDIGLLGRLSTPFGEVRAGLTIRELGFGARLGERDEGWSTDLALGAAWIHPSGLLGVLDLSTDYLAVGLGWALFRELEVRGGVRLQGGLVQWSLGLGVRWQAFAVDYALLTHPWLAPSHRFGFGVSF